MTYSGRRVKKRNLDEGDSNGFRNKQTRKSGHRQKSLKKKSSTLKSLRPQRAAARNARSFFSKITGTSTDGEDEDGSDGELSESANALQDSNIDGEESSRSLLNEQRRRLKGKEVSLEKSEDTTKLDIPESHVNAGTRRLFLKLPACDSSKNELFGSSSYKYNQLDNLVGASWAHWEMTERNGNQVSSLDQGCSSAVAIYSLMERGGRGQFSKSENHVNLSDGIKDGKIRWGGVRARSSKRLRLGETMPSDSNTKSIVRLGGHKEKKNQLNGHLKPERDGIDISYSLETAKSVDKMDEDEVLLKKVKNLGGENSEILTGSEFRCYHESSKCVNMIEENKIDYPIHCQNGTNQPPEQKEVLAPISTKLRLSSKRVSKDAEGLNLSIEIPTNGKCDALHDSSLDTKQNSVLEALEDDGTNRTSSDHVANGSRQLDAHINCTSSLHESVGSHSLSKKMFDVVYRRSKISRDKINSEGDSVGIGESTSNANNNNFDEGTNDQSHRTCSMGLNTSTNDPNIVSNNWGVEQHDHPGDMHRSVQNRSISICQLPYKEWGSSSRMTVGLRSIRNRRSSYLLCDSSPTATDRLKTHQSSRKGSWLMLSTHEEGSRYIPQLGDGIAYLRQGHQEYINYSCSREVGPWNIVRGTIGAVEFCKVESLEYASVSGSGDSCCKMALKFVDPQSSVFNKTFKLTLPEVTSFPDFLVERTRFDAAIQRNWTCRDKCKVWWKNEGEEDGSWWDGRILYVKPKSSEFPDSPWERYAVQYKNEPRETHLHSPWELFDSDTQWEQPSIDDHSRCKLLSALAKLEQSADKVQDQYGVQKLKQVSHKSNFTNRFPVPLSLEVIQSRLENNYYRSLEAVRHDISVTLSNAESYFGRNPDLSTKIKHLSDWFTRTLSSLQPSEFNEIGQ